MKGDCWLSFEDETLKFYDKNIYEKLAYDALELINNEAEEWWSNKEYI